MKQQKLRKFISFLLILAMCLPMLPTGVFAAGYMYPYNPNSKQNTTITVMNATGTEYITGAQIDIDLAYNLTYEVIEQGNGQYVFTRPSTYWSYELTVSASGYLSQFKTISGTTSSTIILLQEDPNYVPPTEPTVPETTEPETTEPEPTEPETEPTNPGYVSNIQTFRIFYIANGVIPNSYAGAGEAVNYGPSGNDTPLLEIQVDIGKLETYTELVVREDWKDSNEYHFVPKGSSNGTVTTEVINFWNAVKDCMTEESIEAFKETGLYYEFVGYCLKKQSGGSQHCDGVLFVKPPVYVVELYQNNTYFGGTLTDSSTGSQFLTSDDILNQFKNHLKQDIIWTAEDAPLLKDGTCTGTYVDTQTHTLYTVTVSQMEDPAHPLLDVQDSELRYSQRSSTYYLARFNITVDQGTKLSYTVTYTDGVDEEALFSNQQYTVQGGSKVPAFNGTPTRDDYIFLGWQKDDDQTAVYSDADIANMTVTADTTFSAVWIPVPKYTGTIHVILDGTWDANTMEVRSGTYVDLHEMLELNATTTVAVSADGQTFIPADRISVGTYAAQLENGTYHIYYSENGGAYTLASYRVLVMENQDRERYLFYNSVTYDPNGGTFNGSTEKHVHYFPSGTEAYVHDAAPQRDGYKFMGWKAADGTIYQDGQLLQAAIDRAYVLTAQWEASVNLFVNVELHHFNHPENHNPDEELDSEDALYRHNNDQAKHNITFTLDGRPVGSTGDYTELYRKTITWDGTSAFNVDGYSATIETAQYKDLTTYTADEPIFTQVVRNMEYTLTSAKLGYEVFEISQEEKDNGDIVLTVKLMYKPDDFAFNFHVELDDLAKAMSQDVRPVAVNVKATAWHDTPNDNEDTVDWFVTPQHENTYYRVVLNQNGEGNGSVPVAKMTTDGLMPYSCRIQVVSFELADGSVVAAPETNPNISYATNCGHYSAVIEVEGGNTPSGSTLSGAYYNNALGEQDGKVTAIVSIHPHKLTLDANGGLFSDSTAIHVIPDLLKVPDLSGYVPTRNGGYLFDGWYLVDVNGNMTDTQLAPGTGMQTDLTFRAKWIPPVTVSGLVSVAATYEQQNSDGSVTVQTIPESGRVQHILVLLQRKNPSGYYETVDQQEVMLDYSKQEYYFQKNNNVLPVGVAEYAFTQLPGNNEYRIYILSTNYHSTYQQEPDSINKPLVYNEYTADANYALWGTVDPNTATVNAHLHFEPSTFELQFQVDATAIGQGYHPDSAEILITSDKKNATYTDPSQWPVISQMVFGDTMVGCNVALENGKGSGSDVVWRTAFDGATIYDYGLRLASTTTGTVNTPYTDNQYYTVTYQAPASYIPETGNQTQMLVAYLIPKVYAINYDTKGGRLTGDYPSDHTWSYATSADGAVPVRSGYEFLGWYTDAALTQPLDSNTISADVAEDITLYAKWAKVSVHVKVVIDHYTADNNRNTDFNKLLNVQLQSRPAGSDGAYTDVAGQALSYTSEAWHKSLYKDTLDIDNAFVGVSSNYDYNATAYMDGYHVVDQYDANTVTGVVRTETTADDGNYVFYVATVCLKAHSDARVVFHTNNQVATCEDQFRVYYPADMPLPEGGYAMNSNGTVSSFYDIPQFSYETHNDYIFAGWYTAADDSGKPISWSTAYKHGSGITHMYAHWIHIGEIDQHETDTKELTGSTYREYDLAGVQIRKESADDEDHLDSSGNVISGSQQRIYSGLRFVAVLSSRVYNALDALSSSTVEYGFVISRTDTAEYYAEDRGLTQLQYRGSNVNGEDTGSLYNFVQNMRCSGVTDHFSCDDYRLYTGVITYKNQTGQDNPILARAYLRYTDANGLLRTYYNNYTGTNLLGGCSASYTQVYNMLNPDSN